MTHFVDLVMNHYSTTLQPLNHANLVTNIMVYMSTRDWSEITTMLGASSNLFLFKELQGA